MIEKGFLSVPMLDVDGEILNYDGIKAWLMDKDKTEEI